MRSLIQKRTGRLPTNHTNHTNPVRGFVWFVWFVGDGWGNHGLAELGPPNRLSDPRPSRAGEDARGPGSAMSRCALAENRLVCRRNSEASSSSKAPHENDRQSR